jgi:hypothetical protein
VKAGSKESTLTNGYDPVIGRFLIRGQAANHFDILADSRDQWSANEYRAEGLLGHFKLRYQQLSLEAVSLSSECIALNRDIHQP